MNGEELIYKDESFKIIGLCFEIHKYLGRGLSEIVYKDALEYEFKNSNIPYEREKQFKVRYKDIYLDHFFFADFVVYDKIIVEIKATNKLIDDFISQTLNYLAISECELGLLVNFGESSLKYKRIAKTK